VHYKFFPHLDGGGPRGPCDVRPAKRDNLSHPAPYFVACTRQLSPVASGFPNPTMIRVTRASRYLSSQQYCSACYTMAHTAWQRCVDTFPGTVSRAGPAVLVAPSGFGLVSMNKLARLQMRGGLYKINCHQRGRFCRGLFRPVYFGTERARFLFKLSYYCTGGRIALHNRPRRCV